MKLCSGFIEIWRGGGVVLFELEDYSRQIEDVRRNGTHLYWEEFPQDDPFKYGLYKLDLDSDKNIVYDKIFIRRDNGKEEYFKNVLKSYTRDESIKLLNRHEMKTEIYPYYDEGDAVNNGHEHDLYRVLAWK